MADLTPQAFVDKWENSKLSERSASQQHFLDLCRMLGQKTPAEADPEGNYYTFERHVKKTGAGAGGGKGFADVWYQNRFAWEYKGPHKDLEAAYNQLLLYREDLGNPPLLVVSDMDRFEVHTNFTSTVKQVYSFSTAEVPEPENLRVLRALFEDPGSLRPDRTAESVTAEAAEKFALLADGLYSRGEDPRRAAHFLNKLLFCLFAEDVGLLPEGLFGRVVERTRQKPERFAQYAGELFTAMSAGGYFLLEDIPSFNGGLFADGDTLPLESAELGILAAASRLDWGSVEPAIFGTLFERSLDPAQRSQLGAHYTSREDILAVVEPVLMAPLRREWEAVRREAETLYDRQQEGGRSAARKRGDQRKIEAGISGFVERMREVRVLDPACGSGNFLYVSLRQLLNLEKEVSAFAGKVGLNPFFPGVSPEQLHGIEMSPYAHELAQVSIWIGYLQWMVENGFGSRQEPILGPMTNIVEMDAVLGRDEDGTLREPEWPEADVIIGNPPFLGGKRLRTELEDAYVDDLFALYGDRVPREADFVCYWFEKARAGIRSRNVSRAGLLATNSIRGGANREVLAKIRDSGDIFFAHADRPWILDGAAVRVSMVGFDDGSETDRTLDGAPVENIYPDLTGDLDLTSAVPLPENKSIAFMGDTKGGPFDISPERAREMLPLPNPHGRPNSEVVKPWANGLDITRRPRGMYIVDFGTGMTGEQAALYEAPFEYVNEHVRPKRESSRSTRPEWWLHERPRVDMREALTGLSRYLATARVAKHRLFVWLDEATLPDSQIIAFAHDDDYFFGVLHSRAHEVWALRMGTFLGKGNDPRYTPTTCFETFPFPEPSEEGRAEVAEAARELDAYRRNWLDPEGATGAELKRRTLTNLYNERPAWLTNAHARLDGAIYALYGWSADLPDEEALKNLLALNVQRSGERAGYEG